MIASEMVLVPGLVAQRAVAIPGAPAVTAADGALTYGELDRRATRLAHRLRALGVGADVLVAVALERSCALVVAQLAVLRAGGAYVPLDPGYPPDRLAFILDDARPAVLLTTRALAERFGAAVPLICMDDADDVADDDGAAWPAPRGEDLAYVIYTSGSTGRPKGVEISHASLANLVAWHIDAFAVTCRDRATQLASPGFDAAVWELWPHLCAGASIHMPDEATRVDPEALRDWLLDRAITIAFVPTPLAERLLALEWPAAAALRVLLTGADTLHVFPRAGLPFVLVNNYGPTECTVVTTSGVVPPGERAERPTIGRAIANVETIVLDDAGRPARPGEPGELYVGGASLARGYRGRPDLTAERFVPDPRGTGARLYRTGDRVRTAADGTLAFLGRIDDQIKIRGFRIEPAEIVAVLDAHPHVASSNVVAREDGPDGARLVAYVVPANGVDPRPAELAGSIRAVLPDYMVPATFVRLPALPLSPNGKVDRAALPAPDAENTLREGARVAPRSPVEARLAAIVAALLEVADVGVEDNFFLLGGHSLLGTQLIARIRDGFGVELGLRTVFDGPTVAALSREIEQAILARLERVAA